MREKNSIEKSLPSNSKVGRKNHYLQVQNFELGRKNY
jgi:hypothetical protein